MLRERTDLGASEMQGGDAGTFMVVWNSGSMYMYNFKVHARIEKAGVSYGTRKQNTPEEQIQKKKKKNPLRMIAGFTSGSTWDPRRLVVLSS